MGKLITMNLQRAYFDAVEQGVKTVEGRPADGKFATLNVDDFVEFHLDGDSERPAILIKITNIVKYASFKEMLENVGIQACLPGACQNVEEGTRLYHSFPEYRSREERFGVIAIMMQKV